MSVALKLMIILQNLTATNQRKSGEGIVQYVRKLTKLDVMMSSFLHSFCQSFHTFFAYGCPDRGREFEKSRDKERLKRL